MPIGLAEESIVYEADRPADENFLARLIGCVLEYDLDPGHSMQCLEVYSYIAGDTDLALNTISNVQVDDAHVDEVRAYMSVIFTSNGGSIDKAIIYDATNCFGDVGECIGLRAETIEFKNGWQMTTAGDGLLIRNSTGSVVECWGIGCAGAEKK
jgi:hypothetical protein